MSKATINLSYSGPALKGHVMDVSDLAPALLAFGNLCKEANSALNYKRASIKVLVRADIQANCVTISLDVIWSIVEAAKTLIKNEDVTTAKELIEWIGLFGVPVFGLFQYLRAKGNKRVEQETEIIDGDGNNRIEVKFVGSNNKVIVSPQVKKLSENHNVVKAAKGVVLPVAERTGIESAEFHIDGKEAESISKEYAKEVVDASVGDEVEPQYIIGHITVYETFFARKPKKWKFLYNGHVEEIDIGETNIAGKILQRRKVVMGDTFTVRMEITEKMTASGFKLEYKVVEVLGFTSGNEQPDLLSDDEENNT